MGFAKDRVSSEEAKVFVLSAVALSAGIFTIAFWYGVFETIFFEHLFYVWVASTVALVASLILPPVDALPAFVSWRGRFMLILPTLWLLFEATADSTVSLSVADEWILWGLSAAVVIITLPYLLYVLVLIAVPDIDQLRTPILRYALVAIVAAIAIAGVVIGQNHPLFLTCRDFQVAGSDVPGNCRDAPSYLTPAAEPAKGTRP